MRHFSRHRVNDAQNKLSQEDANTGTEASKAQTHASDPTYIEQKGPNPIRCGEGAVLYCILYIVIFRHLLSRSQQPNICSPGPKIDRPEMEIWVYCICTMVHRLEVGGIARVLEHDLQPPGLWTPPRD